MTHERRTLLGRAYAAVLAAMDRFDEAEGKLSPAEWASVASQVSVDLIRLVAEAGGGSDDGGSAEARHR